MWRSLSSSCRSRETVKGAGVPELRAAPMVSYRSRCLLPLEGSLDIQSRIRIACLRTLTVGTGHETFVLASIGDGPRQLVLVGR
jgi:hypothetical protein